MVELRVIRRRRVYENRDAYSWPMIVWWACLLVVGLLGQAAMRLNSDVLGVAAAMLGWACAVGLIPLAIIKNTRWNEPIRSSPRPEPVDAATEARVAAALKRRRAK